MHAWCFIFSVHYSSKRAQLNKTKNIFKTIFFGPPRGPKVNPLQNRKSPDLANHFSKRAQFNNISGPPGSPPGTGIYVVLGAFPRSPVSSALAAPIEGPLHFLFSLLKAAKGSHPNFFSKGGGKPKSRDITPKSMVPFPYF